MGTYFYFDKIFFSRFAFEQENTENSIKEHNRLKEEIENLVSYPIPDLDDIDIDFQVWLTLIDGHTRTYWQEKFSKSDNNCPLYVSIYFQI